MCHSLRFSSTYPNKISKFHGLEKTDPVVYRMDNALHSPLSSHLGSVVQRMKQETTIFQVDHGTSRNTIDVALEIRELQNAIQSCKDG